MTDKSIYDAPEGVDGYTAMAEGYDGQTHVDRLGHLLTPGSAVLELGMGPGVDLELLAKTFAVVGSDRSQAFLDRYAAISPETELLLLDAVTIDTDQRFDAIYSNKVLHHLTSEELRRSFERQAEILRPDGILIHGPLGRNNQRVLRRTQRSALHARDAQGGHPRRGGPPRVRLLSGDDRRRLTPGRSSSQELLHYVTMQEQFVPSAITDD